METSDGISNRFHSIRAASSCMCNGSTWCGGGPLRICHIVYGYFPFDPRVRREVETLARSGNNVEVIAMREAGEAQEENVGGVHVHRIPWPVIRGGKARYLVQYSVFFFLAALRLLGLHLKNRFHIVH